MDAEHFLIGLAMVVLGLAGVYASYSGVALLGPLIAHTFREGLQGPSALMLAIGAILMFMGFFKDGMPTLTKRGAIIFLAMLAALASATVALLTIV